MIKNFLLGLFLVCLGQGAWAAKHLAVVYPTEAGWRVDHIKVEDQKLQDLVESKSFDYEFEARAFARTVNKLNNKNSSMVRIVTTEQAVAPLWNVTREWNQEWEDKYSAWVEKNLDADFFVRHNLATDCADAAYSLRWIFARNNGLPAAATLTGTGAIISHLSAKAEWNNLPGHAEWDKDQRFLAAMEWLLNNVYTGSLILDAFPVEISRQTIRAGLVHLIGLTHAEVFNKVSFDPEEVPLQVLSSTVPRTVRTLAYRVFMDGTISSEDKGGLLQFRWPIKKNQRWDMVPRTEMPHYSLDQYNSNLCQNERHFALCLIRKLGINFQPDKITKKILSNIESSLVSRQNILIEGYAFCKINDCSPGTEGWENWGTPSRDKRLAKTFKDTRNLAEQLGTSSIFYDWLQKTKVPGLDMFMYQISPRLEARLLSYDPRDSLDSRWALNNLAIAQTQNRRLQEVNILRESLIAKASGCRSNPEACQKEKNSFSELSTVEIDHQFRNDLELYFKYCLGYSCANQNELRRALAKSFTQSPAPWDSLDERQGIAVPPEAHFLFASKNVAPGSPDYLILDNSQVYKISQRKIVSTEYSGSLHYHKASRQYIRVTYKSVSFLDENFIETKQFPLRQIRSSYRVFDFKNGQFLLYPCEYEHNNKCSNGGNQNSAYIFDPSKETLESTPTYSSFLIDEVGKAVLLIDQTKTMLLEAKGEGYLLTDLPLVKSITEMITLKSQEALVISYEGSLSIKILKLSAQGVTKLNSENSHFGLKRINSSFALVESEEESFILNKNLEHWSHSGNYEFSLSPSFDQRLMIEYEKNDDDHSNPLRILMFDKSLVSTLKLTLPGDSAVIGATPQWLSVIELENREAHILTYGGRILESSPHYAKISCRSNNLDGVCYDPDNLLMGEIYFPPVLNGALGMTSYYKVGLREGSEVQKPYAYVSRQATEDSYEPEKDYSNVVETGRAIILSNNLLLWFP